MEAYNHHYRLLRDLLGVKLATVYDCGNGLYRVTLTSGEELILDLRQTVAR